jgi:DNA polymerase III subunit alpha
MAFVTTEDLAGSIETTVFSSVYETVRDILVEDGAVLIEGLLQRDENSVKILADRIVPLEDAEKIWTASIHVNIDLTRADRETLQKLRDILQKFPGSCRGYLHLRETDQTETVICLPDTLLLDAGKPLILEVNRLLGYDAVQTRCKAATSSIGNGRKSRRPGFAA